MRTTQWILLSHVFALGAVLSCHTTPPEVVSQGRGLEPLQLNQKGTFEKRGLSVTAFSDFYPEGHQGGVTVVLNGVRVAANGDVRLEPTGGQWQPIPRLDRRTVDPNLQIVTAMLSDPDPARDRTGFNPIEYPALAFSYKVHVRPDCGAFRIVVDLNEPLPREWVGRVGFNLELFPGEYFGTTYRMDDQAGLFPRQFNGPMALDQDPIAQGVPLAVGRRLSVAPDRPDRHLVIESETGPLELLDGRAQHDSGWFVVRPPMPGGATTGALEWKVTCHALPDYRYSPVSHNHFDGYVQGPSTLCTYAPGQPVPGLNVGGWHDAGDYDLRVESQIETVRILSQAFEAFCCAHDATFVDQEQHTV